MVKINKTPVRISKDNQEALASASLGESVNAALKDYFEVILTPILSRFEFSYLLHFYPHKKLLKRPTALDKVDFLRRYFKKSKTGSKIPYINERQLSTKISKLDLVDLRRLIFQVEYFIKHPTTAMVHTRKEPEFQDDWHINKFYEDILDNNPHYRYNKRTLDLICHWYDIDVYNGVPMVELEFALAYAQSWKSFTQVEVIRAEIMCRTGTDAFVRFIEPDCMMAFLTNDTLVYFITNSDIELSENSLKAFNEEVTERIGVKSCFFAGKEFLQRSWYIDIECPDMWDCYELQEAEREIPNCEEKYLTCDIDPSPKNIEMFAVHWASTQTT